MRTYNVAADLKSAADSRSGGSGDPLEQDLLLASRNRGNHVVADEITWEQYILKNALAGKQRGVFLKPNAPKFFAPHCLLFLLPLLSLSPT